MKREQDDEPTFAPMRPRQKMPAARTDATRTKRAKRQAVALRTKRARKASR